MLDVQAPFPRHSLRLPLLCHQGFSKRIEKWRSFGVEWAQQDLDDRLSRDHVGDLPAASGNVLWVGLHRHTDADAAAAWELIGALANFIGALRLVVVTDRSSHFFGFFFRQRHVLLALQDAQQRDSKLFDFSPIGFVLRLLQHILDAFGQNDSLVQLLTMDLSYGAEDLELTGSPGRLGPVLPLGQVHIVVMQLQERSHLVDVHLGRDLHSVAPPAWFVRAFVLELVEVQAKLIFAIRQDLGCFLLFFLTISARTTSGASLFAVSLQPQTSALCVTSLPIH